MKRFISDLQSTSRILSIKNAGILSLLLISFTAQAKIWTVDNSPGAGPDHTNLQTCINTANSGDTIIVMPSYTNYGGVILSKKVFLYSRGHSNNLLDKDKRAAVSHVTFNTGSNQSTVMGLLVTGYLLIYSHNNVIRNNWVQGSSSLIGNNNLLQGNVFTNYNTLGFNASAENNLILNNVFNFSTSGGFGAGVYFIQGGNSSNLIANNFFAELMYSGGNISSGGSFMFWNSYAKIYNNIIWSNVNGRAAFNLNNGGSVFKNNLTYSANTNPAPLPGNNFNDTMPSFEGGYNNSTLPFFSTTADFRLKAGTVGTNAGTDSTDIGVYGQNYPFSTEGNVPGVAIFDDFEILNPVLKKGGTLKVRISARKPE